MSLKQLSIADFRTFRRRLTLVGTLRLETPLRIGTGQADELSGADIAVMKDAQRRPFIPGSSFKGALRSHTERLLRALCPNTDMRESACDPLTDSGRCIPGGRVLGVPDTILTIQNLRERAEKEARAEKRSPAQVLAEQTWTHSCRVCRVFGSPWLASKVLIKDLSLKYPAFWYERGYQVRAGVGIERDSDAAQSGILYTSELVPAGTEFVWEIVLDNADPDEDEPLIFLALREMEHGHIPLGGARSRGLGRVSLAVDQAASVDSSSLLDYLISNQPQNEVWDNLLGRIPALVRSIGGTPAS